MPATLVDPATLASRLADPDWVVLDVRHDLVNPGWGEEEYAYEHIPGARFLHLDRDLSGPKTGRNGRHPLPAPEAAAAVFGRAGIGADTQVVVYDQSHGQFAARAWWMLRWLGHVNVAVLDGGWDRWMREKRPITPDVPVVSPAAFAVRRLETTVTTADVLDGLDRGTLLVIDARTPERFRGEVEPFDPVAGRVPGAVNRPTARNLAADGTFKPARELAAEFAALLGGRDPANAVMMCGSGVTACHNMLALEVAGVSGARLYPGSWSEWCADPARPVASGPVTAPRAGRHTPIRVVVFDVFGTCVDWRGSLIDAFTAFGAATNRRADWVALVDAWRGRYQPQLEECRSGRRAFAPLDTLHRESLDRLLAEFGLDDVREDERVQLNLGWHRLRPWPDVVGGLTALKRRFVVGPLSNGSFALLTGLAKFAGLPWDAIFSAELFRAYKPQPAAYLGVAQLMQVDPAAVMLCAAHNDDLAAARACGLATAFVPRPTEHGPAQRQDLAPGADWDVVARDFNDLAARL